jgi:hyperosmotically inducible protein
MNNSAPSSTSSTGDASMGNSVQMAVESALVAKPGFENVVVSVGADGVATLTGTVKTAADKSSAQATASATAGVKSVKNDLTIAK